MNRAEANCELCAHPGGVVLWQSAECRVVRVDEPHYPGFCRVIWNAHVREMSDLPPVKRRDLMEVVFAVEAVIRELFVPDKINLASFGNVVPHLHWHVIPRWVDDRHFPESIWGQIHNEQATARPPVGDDVLAQTLQRALRGMPEVMP
ncbi:MAG: HIT family protein [Azonexus sp.]|jgi:diadenosine tetraphosphate (Ap4A) HIT family hydrolase|uniref:HIT family protein n=1 Tax=Azonexus sp. TaxID=1872668 RepID=UPI00283689CA|nr:HIT family protein [Azonexus sp.]MDR0777121.1 HIT family protein [Azonexus sp.]